ncbi:MAG TPA: hypothetical protein VKR41_11325 [Puia sp.]|nr:hypothetical protein [Puia sp.]
MKRAPLLAVPCFLCACTYQVYVNRHLSYKTSRTSAEWLKKNDNFLVVSPSQQIPDSAILIERAAVCHTAGLTSVERLRQRQIDQLKPEAQKVGANLIRETAATTSRDIFDANLYLLKEPYKASYAHTRDSIRLSHQDSCRVHIWDNTPFGNCALYFNRSWIGYCRSPAQSGGSGTVESCTYTFLGSGRLTFTVQPGRVKGRGIRLQKGKEYYLLIYETKYGAIIQADKIYNY